jgi:hypothetical protein
MLFFDNHIPKLNLIVTKEKSFYVIKIFSFFKYLINATKMIVTVLYRRSEKYKT